MKKILLYRFIIGFIIITNIFSLIIWREENQYKLQASGLDDKSTGTVTLYEWKRVYSKDDLPTTENKDYYMWLVWETHVYDKFDEPISDRYWYIAGSSHGGDTISGHEYATSSSDFQNQFSLSVRQFITTKTYDLLRIRYVGTNSNRPDNQGASKQYQIFLSDGTKLDAYDDFHDDEALNFGDGDSDRWGIYVGPSGSSDNYCKSASYEGWCAIVSDLSGLCRDVGFKWRGGTSFSGFMNIISNSSSLYAEQDAEWDDFDRFIIYIGTPKVYSKIISDLTVKSGNVLNLDGEIVIPEGVTITIEPGAVLSVEGNVFLHGTIKNYGTVIIQPNGNMQPINNAAKGKINCWGSDEKFTLSSTGETVQAEGNVVVMKKGTLGISSNGSLSFTKGATLYNEGAIINPGTTVFADNALFTNNGQYVVGMKLLGVVYGYSIYYDDKKLYTGSDKKTQLGTSTCSSSVSISSTANISGNKIINGKEGKTIG